MTKSLKILEVAYRNHGARKQASGKKEPDKSASSDEGEEARHHISKLGRTARRRHGIH